MSEFIDVEAEQTAKFEKIMKNSASLKMVTNDFDNCPETNPDNQKQRSEPKVYHWPEITKLNTALPPVVPFSYDLLPKQISSWVKDIAERTQCPPDFVAVTVMCALSSVVGNKRGIHPKQFDDWLVTPNLWGALIGRPSAMKSPAMAEGLKPLKRLAAESLTQFKLDLEEHGIDKIFAKQQSALLEAEVKKALKSQKVVNIEVARKAVSENVNDKKNAPTEKRYIVNDSTIEKLGELLNENPSGLLLVRDELTGWLSTINREDHANDRAFYLECFSGDGSYTYDRIGRGTIHIENTTLSIVGGIQPSKLRPLVAAAVNQGLGDDGLMQRFQLAVFPDDSGQWVNVDRWPDTNLKDAVYKTFKALDDLPSLELNEFGDKKGVHFDDDGQAVFNDWRLMLETKIRESGIHPAMESHLTKYRSLMPSIALIINVIEVGHNLPVTEASALIAVNWCHYLESHANRIYGAATDITAINAQLILDRKDKLLDGFKVKDIRQKGWAGLGKTEDVKEALNELIECGYLRNKIMVTGGRESSSYYWRPDEI